MSVRNWILGRLLPALFIALGAAVFVRYRAFLLAWLIAAVGVGIGTPGVRTWAAENRALLALEVAAVGSFAFLYWWPGNFSFGLFGFVGAFGPQRILAFIGVPSPVVFWGLVGMAVFLVASAIAASGGGDRAAARAGVECRMYEGTKHASASAAARRGVRLEVLQLALGHADVRSTARYSKLAPMASVAVMRPERPECRPF